MSSWLKNLIHLKKIIKYIDKISIKLNKIALNYTFEELIKTNIASETISTNFKTNDILSNKISSEILFSIFKEIVGPKKKYITCERFLKSYLSFKKNRT